MVPCLKVGSVRGRPKSYGLYKRSEVSVEDLKAMDYISDLPQNIIEVILTFLPIRDAVRTCMLSSKWRYRWTTLSNLVFDDKCAMEYDDWNLVTESQTNFITRTLFLHQGPIHKFQLSTWQLRFYEDIEQWILFLSRGDLKELLLELDDSEWFRVPSCLFNCKKLTRLELNNCELDPPPAFKGFLWLKSLTLYHFWASPEAIESFLSSCPLLENLYLCSPVSCIVLNVRAPNLKYLSLDGEFKDICLENTPLLVDLSVSLSLSEYEIPKNFEQRLGSDFVKIFGSVPRLERFTGDFAFTKYVSIGDYRGMQPITYSCLKVIELDGVNFEDMKERLVLLRLITNSPQLKELLISGLADAVNAREALDVDFWEKRWPKDCIFRHLKVVKMVIAGVRHEMEFIKFLLANSPVLEMMSIRPYPYVTRVTYPYVRSKMWIELLRFRRASAQAEIFFVEK